MRAYTFPALFTLICSLFNQAIAQQTNSLETEIELGAVFTSGNTDDENVRYGLTMDYLRGDWEYQFSSDGLRSSKDNVLSAQRLYHVGMAQYALSENSFINARAAYEDDRFSGFDSQSDFTVNYGRNLLLNRENMDLSLEIGAGVRRSETETEDFEEGILRFEGNYQWNLTETSDFTQDFSVESGSESSIMRSETAVTASILENLSMRFSVKVKHQSDVPVGREKTDTQTAITLVLNF